MLSRKEDKKATGISVCRNVTPKLQVLGSYAIHHDVNIAKIIPLVHAFFRCHLKNCTLYHWQQSTLNSIQRLTQYSKKSIPCFSGNTNFVQNNCYTL